MDTSRWLLWVLLVPCFGGLACGGGAPKDRPADCRDDEFYNERTKRCTSCPAVSPPDCARGCDYTIDEDERGCPMARCQTGCRQCPEGETYSTETGVCERCPGAPDCASLACEGELTLEEDEGRACPGAEAYACGECRHPERGCVADESGACVDRQE